MSQKTSKNGYGVIKRKVVVQTNDGLNVTGIINTHPHKRVSDFMQETEKLFIPVYEANTGSQIESVRKTYIINKNSISWIEPRE